MRKSLQWLINLVKGKKYSDVDEDFFRPILFLFPSLLKKSVSINVDVSDWQKDYLSKNKNIAKYIFGACEALQIIGVSYVKYKKELMRYSDEEFKKEIGTVVGRNFEIEARLALRRTLELFVESWYFKKIIIDKEKVFRHFFLIKNLKALHSRKSNAEIFCDIQLEFDSKLISEIRSELGKIPLQDVFYLNKNKKFNSDSDVKDLLKSFFKLFKEAVPQMTEGPRAMVGESYQLYAESSDVVHGYSGGPNFNLKNYHREIWAIYARAAVLASNVLKHLVIIGSDVIKNNNIKEAINGLQTDNLPQNISINVGDKVLVLKQIRAEVVEISNSAYGCKKYKVKYGDKREGWNWSFEREWFLQKDLSRL
jgi:hypothetical protein